jgi:hypothetical protein
MTQLKAHYEPLKPGVPVRRPRSPGPRRSALCVTLAGGRGRAGPARLRLAVPGGRHCHSRRGRSKSLTAGSGYFGPNCEGR